MTQLEVLSADRDRAGGYKVDVNRGERVGRASSEWFSRPADKRYLSLSDLYAAVRGRTEHSRTRTVESAAIRVEASRDNAERLALMLPGSAMPIAPTHSSFGQLAGRAHRPRQRHRRGGLARHSAWRYQRAIDRPVIDPPAPSIARSGLSLFHRRWCGHDHSIHLPPPFQANHAKTWGHSRLWWVFTVVECDRLDSSLRRSAFASSMRLHCHVSSFLGHLAPRRLRCIDLAEVWLTPRTAIRNGLANFFPLPPEAAFLAQTKKVVAWPSFTSFRPQAVRCVSPPAIDQHRGRDGRGPNIRTRRPSWLSSVLSLRARTVTSARSRHSHSILRC